MIKVYYDKRLGYYRYFIPIPYFSVIIKSASINVVKGNKRKRGARSWFSHLSRVSVWNESIDLSNLNNFLITEREFLKWIGWITIDIVLGLDDMGWLLTIKQKYESVL